jgi:serine phosphatase RsbU (regulator of sigma subunit)
MAALSEQASSGRKGLVEWAFASRAKEGEDSSGDRHVVAPFAGGMLLAVLDGLGHGDEAAAASEVAARTLEAQPELSVLSLLRRCHVKLLETRGVVMSLGSFNAYDGSLTWIGVGNVEGVLVRADGEAVPARESLLLRGGVVGYQLPALYASVIPVAPRDLLVFATDGVRNEFAAQVVRGERPQQIADRILCQHGKGTDDALVLVAEFQGGSA